MITDNGSGLFNRYDHYFFGILLTKNALIKINHSLSVSQSILHENDDSSNRVSPSEESVFDIVYLLIFHEHDIEYWNWFFLPKVYSFLTWFAILWTYIMYTIIYHFFQLVSINHNQKFSFAFLLRPWNLSQAKDTILFSFVFSINLFYMIVW